MTQALNLSQFANFLNTSGQTSNAGLQNSAITINTTSPITGGASPALGGTMTIAHANSGVTATSYTNANITVNAQGHITAASNGSAGSTGTVTSVGSGNGLQGGTITTSGTLSVACPAFNTVGSYCFLGAENGGYGNFAGSNYSVGGGFDQLQAINITFGGSVNIQYGVISGTWKWMGATGTGNAAIGCRVA